MNKAEALTLSRLAKAMCPQQASDDFTPDAWHMLLDDIRFEDAKDALVTHCKAHAFVAPAEIRAGVKRIRAQRLIDHEATHGPIEVPAGLEEGEYREFLRRIRKRIADGDVVEYPALPPSRPMPKLDGVFRAVEA